jgi:hypothetical protein
MENQHVDKEFYMDINHNQVTPDKAKWLIIRSFSDDKMTKEVWVDLKK